MQLWNGISYIKDMLLEDWHLAVQHLELKKIPPLE
jgi:hypothetical protein